MDPIKEALTFDDVTMAPKYSGVLPSEVDTSTKLSANLTLKIPLLSSAMDTVTESKMAIAIAKAGGIGVIHRNLNIKKQIEEIRKVKKQGLLVGAAVGAGPLELKRAEAILKEQINLIVVDTAHGHSKKVAEIVKAIKKIKTKKTTLCAGNIATAEAAKFLIKLGVDIVKVGIGPGSICTTRLVAGIGVPQLSAILAVKQGIKNNKTKIISDGGIKYSGDLAKALSAGADAVMMLRIQLERMSEMFFPNAREYSRYFGLNSDRVKALKPSTLVMHPGPMNRGLEITADAADGARSVIVEQVSNGVSVRMAILYMLLAGAPEGEIVGINREVGAL